MADAAMFLGRADLSSASLDGTMHGGYISHSHDFPDILTRTFLLWRTSKPCNIAVSQWRTHVNLEFIEVPLRASHFGCDATPLHESFLGGTYSVVLATDENI